MKILIYILNIYKSFYFRSLNLKKEGRNCTYKAFSSKFICPQNMSLGDDVQLGPNTEIDATGEVSIGSGVIFAPGVIVYSRTHNFSSDDLDALPFDNKIILSKVVIKDFVWVGRNVIILPGVTIGKAAVIGAGAVVSKDVPDYAIAVGNPARVVKYRNSEQIEKLIANCDNPSLLSRKDSHSKILIYKSK